MPINFQREFLSANQPKTGAMIEYVTKNAVDNNPVLNLALLSSGSCDSNNSVRISGSTAARTYRSMKFSKLRLRSRIRVRRAPGKGVTTSADLPTLEDGFAARSIKPRVTMEIKRCSPFANWRDALSYPSFQTTSLRANRR